MRLNNQPETKKRSLIWRAGGSAGLYGLRPLDLLLFLILVFQPQGSVAGAVFVKNVRTAGRKGLRYGAASFANRAGEKVEWIG